MRLRRARLTGAICLTAFAVALTACSNNEGRGGAAPDSPRKDDNKLVLIAADDPGTLDYVTSNLTALSLWIPDNVVEPLLHLKADGSPGPGLAESWDVTNGGKTYVFHLRDAKFSDGSTMTAEDVVYSMEAMRSSGVGLNSTPYAAVESIEATGEQTVTVTLRRPSQAFVEGMASLAGLVQPRKGSKLATEPIGTGPYTVAEYKPDNHLVLESNPDYWGDKPSIEEIEIRFISDPAAALNALQAGEADAYPYVGEELWERLVNEGLDKTFDLETYPQGGNVFFLNFNTTKAPYDDPALRHALAKAIDREAYVDIFNAPWGLAPTCTFNRAAEASMDDCLDTYDPEAARAELTDAGYADTPIEFTSVSDIGNLILPADLAVAQFEDAGVKVKREQMDLARYSQVVFNGSPPQYGVTIMTTEYTIEQMASCTDPAKAGWKTYCEPDMAELLQRADSAADPKERDELMAKAQARFQEDAVIIPIMASKGVALLNPQLEGWTEPTVSIAIDLANMHWS